MRLSRLGCTPAKSSFPPFSLISAFLVFSCCNCSAARFLWPSNLSFLASIFALRFWDLPPPPALVMINIYSLGYNVDVISTHVNSTLILLTGDFPSSNEEWWYNFRQDFIRSKFSNSTKPNPRHFSGWLRSVATRISEGGFFAKCLETESTFAVKGRFPVLRS